MAAAGFTETFFPDASAKRKVDILRVVRGHRVRDIDAGDRGENAKKMIGSFLSARHARLPLLVATIVLGGCAAVGPDYVAPSTPSLPATWSGATAAASASALELSVWWEQMGDPVLSDLVVQAMQGNADLRRAQARLEQVRALRDVASAQRAPSVSAGVSGSASRTSNTPGTVRSSNAGFDASWEIDVFGGKRRALEAAQADLQSTAATLEATRVSLAAEVARNYVDLRVAQKRLAIARSNLASQSETLQLTEWRAQAGLVGSLDVEQARANREQTRAQIPTLQTGIAEAQHRLGVLLGVAPAALQDRLDPAASVPQAPEQIAAGIPADVLRQRPDVRAAERTLAAETARVGQAEAARYPSFSLSGSIGLEALSFDGLTNGATHTRSLLASITGPVFDAGRLRRQADAQRAVAAGAQASYESTVLTALEEVENALVDIRNTRTRRAALGAALEAARNAALLARNRYTGGLIDFQTVLDTERTVLALEDSLATSEGDSVLAVVQLYKALGGGWSPAQS
jgi:NodT family efflux transporter outer membrane factor (OMF) lipoprotein